MLLRALFKHKLRLTTLGITGVLAGSIIYPNASVLADTLSPASPTAPISAASTSDMSAEATSGVAVTDHTTTVTAADVATALRHDGGLLGASDQTNATSDGNSAIQAVTAGATLDVPRDASEGVTFGAPYGPSLDIQLPNADNAQNAQQVAPGTVAYPATNGSANAIQATEDGGLRMLTIIDNPKAPTTYDYKITIPNGGKVSLVVDGSAAVVDSNGATIATVARPWAHDATGRRIRTYFTTDSVRLVQHIEHNVAGVVYPVTADPFWDAVTNILKNVWKGVLGCIGGKELVYKGIIYFVSKGGTWLVLSRLGSKWVPLLGWVSCGYGAWEGIRY